LIEVITETTENLSCSQQHTTNNQPSNQGLYFMVRKKRFLPDWSEEAPSPASYRAVFKLGDPHGFKHPGDSWVDMLREELGLTNDDFRQKHHEGREPVVIPERSKFSDEYVRHLVEIVGRENVAVDDFSRVKYSHGKTVEETLDLRRGLVRSAADAVVHPRNKEDVRRIVSYCDERRIPVYAYGGGSSVTLGIRPVRGGIVLVLSTHMNRVLEVNEKNQTARVQPGCMGPAYEAALNQAPEWFGTSLRYTCGHFPQSFEMSSVGGWVLTLGSGQASTYYGDVYDLVFSQEYVTPAGVLRTLDYPASATGPKVNDMMKGSEGAFGILVEITMKVFRYMPQNRRRFGFMFADWDAAVNAGREISQGEFGLPAVFRISDAEETEVGLKLYRFKDTILDRLITRLGYRPGKRCLCLGTAEGEKSYARHVQGRIRRICLRHRALPLGQLPVKRWERTRYTEPYVRDDLQDYGILIDTLETAVTWQNFHRLHAGVTNYIKQRPATICMAHASHFYPQGTNLYFIFVTKLDDVTQYKRFQEGIIDRILEHGGSLSHHHGIGKMIAHWMEAHLGKEQIEVLHALKRHFDPHGILSPGNLLVLTDDYRQPNNP
jgi:alkyldihydroxyacetonephosphate synthase